MSKYMPNELRQLQENKKRVMQNVEVAIKKQRKKKYISKTISAIVVAAAIIFIGFISYQLVTDSQKTANEPVVNELITGKYDDVLRKYFAKDQSIKHMYESNVGPFTVETKWLSTNYVVEITNKNSVLVYDYYRIANNKIDLVEESNDGDLTIEELNKKQAILTLLEAPFEKNHKMGKYTLKDFDVTTGYYKNTLVLERIDGDAKMKLVFAPSLGNIESTVEKNGEVVYSSSFSKLTFTLEDESMMFDKIEDVEIEATFNTPWQKSPLGTKKITLVGKGEHGGEEGEGFLLVEDLEWKKQTMFTLANNEYGQITPKDIQWIDENRIFIIIGMAHGTVTAGGDLYILNLKQNTLSPVITDLNEREEISSIALVKEPIYHYEKFVYDTDNMEMSESHKEEGQIQVAVGYVYNINGDVIEYNIGDKSDNKFSKVALIENKDTNALTLEQLNNLNPDDFVEFILVDGVIIHLNKFELPH